MSRVDQKITSRPRRWRRRIASLLAVLLGVGSFERGGWQLVEIRRQVRELAGALTVPYSQMSDARQRVRTSAASDAGLSADLSALRRDLEDTQRPLQKTNKSLQKTEGASARRASPSGADQRFNRDDSCWARFGIKFCHRCRNGLWVRDGDLTAEHVVDEATYAGGPMVWVSQGDRWQCAKLVSWGLRSDLALLEVPDELSALHWAVDEGHEPTDGDFVAAIGGPYGLEGTTTTGSCQGSTKT
jgi:Trypsin-like peptidase domain